MFAVVDVETTGGHASGHKMTEIAIVISNGEEVVGEYTTLLNPQQDIPLNIQALTGISPEMVAEAPLFRDKAQEIREFLADHVFVAHNVNFDYAFVKSAFAECGVDYNPKRLCSVRYSRKVEPGLPSYSLKNITRHFGLKNEAAHRAWGDARVTAGLLNALLQKDNKKIWQSLVKKNSGEFNLPANLDSEEYHKLPEAPGVYYFLDRSGKPIYIGKAANLRKRVASHFISNKETKRSQAFKREIYHIDFECTGSELLAVLLEDHEIRHHWPRYNLAQKNPKKRFGVFAYQGQKGNWSLAINRITSQKGYLVEFYSYNEAYNWVFRQVQKYVLDPVRCGFPETVLPEGNPAAAHDENLERMIDELQCADRTYVIRTPGREAGENGFVYIERGRLTGIGFVPGDTDIRSSSDILSHMRELRNSITTQSIVERALEGERYEVLDLGLAETYREEIMPGTLWY